MHFISDRNAIMEEMTVIYYYREFQILNLFVNSFLYENERKKKRKKRENGSGIQMKMVVKGMVSLIVQSVLWLIKKSVCGRHVKRLHTHTCLKRKRRKNLEKAFAIWFTIGANLNSRLANCRGQGQPLVGSWQLQRTTTAKYLAWNTSRAFIQRKDVSICKLVQQMWAQG